MISLTLFISLFIDECSNIIANSGIAGVQLFPEDIQALILLFADDIALISDTVVGLQRQLHLLRDYCSDSKLFVNVVKTLVAFKKGARIAHHEGWYYDGSLLEVVNCFAYVGLAFTMLLSYQHMCSDLAKKGKYVLDSLISSFSGLDLVFLLYLVRNRHL